MHAAGGDDNAKIAPPETMSPKMARKVVEVTAKGLCMRKHLLNESERKHAKKEGRRSIRVSGWAGAIASP